MTILEAINKVIPDDVKAKIKDIQVKFNAVPATPNAPVALAAIETKLKDGTTLSVDKMEVGGKAQLITTDGTTDAPDASYEAEDGTVITVAGGLISDVKKVAPANEPAAENEMPAFAKALTARLEAIETKFNTTNTENVALKSELTELRESSKVAFSALNAICNLPAGNPIEFSNTEKVEKDPSKYTNYEKAKAARGEKIYV